MRRAALAMFVFSFALITGPACAQSRRDDPRVADIIRSGTLRIGVFPSFQYTPDEATGQPRGLAIDIGNAVSRRLSVALESVQFQTPPEVIACVKSGACDVGFMLIDPARAIDVDFTPAFAKSDFSYFVPSNSELSRVADVDRPGVRVVAVRNHASTLTLLRLAKNAQPVYAGDFEGAVELVRTGKADAFALIRDVLVQYSSQLPGSRVLDDSYQTNLAGVTIPKGNPGRLSFLSEALDGLKRSGSLRQMVVHEGIRGVEVVNP